MVTARIQSWDESSSTGHGYLTFHTIPSGGSLAERMRIDYNGNLLIGKTVTTQNTAGTQISATTGVRATVDQNVASILNRTTNDGSIISLRKDGTESGSIATEGGDMAIGNDDVGLQFINGGKVIRGFNMATNTRADSAVDLGMSTTRFKDLYLAGGVLLSGTAAKNRLENFEDKTEVTSSINLYKGSTLVSSSYNARYGWYARVGNLVYISFYFYVNTGGATASGEYRVYGFPFNFTSLTTYAYQSIQANYLTMNGTNISNSASGDHRWQANSTTYVSLYGQYANTSWTSGLIEFAGSGILYIN